jgi:hypothetical protein
MHLLRLQVITSLRIDLHVLATPFELIPIPLSPCRNSQIPPPQTSCLLPHITPIRNASRMTGVVQPFPLTQRLPHSFPLTKTAMLSQEAPSKSHWAFSPSILPRDTTSLCAEAPSLRYISCKPCFSRAPMQCTSFSIWKYARVTTLHSIA